MSQVVPAIFDNVKPLRTKLDRKSFKLDSNNQQFDYNWASKLLYEINAMNTPTGNRQSSIPLRDSIEHDKNSYRPP